MNYLIVAATIYFSPIGTAVYAQTKVPQDPKTQLTALVDQIEADFQQSRYNTEIEDYQKATLLTESAMKRIDVLIKFFMPLAERIKRTLEVERSIKNQTQNLIDQFIPETKKAIEEKGKSIVQRQLSNRNDTLEIHALVENQLKQLAASPDTNQTGSSPQPDNAKTRETLAQVKNSIKEAVAFENSAINSLEASEWRQAVVEEQRSIEKMEEALKLLQGKSQNQPQDRQNRQSTSDKSNEAQQNQQSGEPNQTKQNPKETTSKMSADEALKELSKINKESRDEKRRREKKYGVVRVPGQIPVEKDW